MLHVSHHIGDFDAVEVVDLAARQYGRYNFVLFGGGKYENHIRRRFLKGFEECIERRLCEHVHLIDDEYPVAADCRWYHHLLDEAADVVDAVVRRRVEFYDIKRTVFIELPAGIALVAGLAVGCARGAVDGFGEDTGARRLAYSTGAAEEVGMSEAVGGDGVFKRHRQGLLAHHAAECRRAVFSCRYDVLFHVLVQETATAATVCKNSEKSRAFADGVILFML